MKVKSSLHDKNTLFSFHSAVVFSVRRLQFDRVTSSEFLGIIGSCRRSEEETCRQRELAELQLRLDE